jgi:hypothetical protein
MFGPMNCSQFGKMSFLSVRVLFVVLSHVIFEISMAMKVHFGVGEQKVCAFVQALH